MESYDRTMELYKAGSLSDAKENSLEVIYEVCLLIAAASGHISQARLDGLRTIYESIIEGIYHLKNWNVPTDKLPPFTQVITGEELGSGEHDRLFKEWATHMLAINDLEFEDYFVRCASLIKGDLFRFFTIKTAALTCSPDGVGNPEAVRFEKFFKCWWGYEDKESIDRVWDDTISFDQELNLRILEVEENNAGWATYN